MALNSELLAILVCPESKQDLSLGDNTMLERINRAIGAGQVINRAGDKVTEPLDALLIRADRKLLYPVRDDIPIMLIEEAILTSGLI